MKLRIKVFLVVMCFMCVDICCAGTIGGLYIVGDKKAQLNMQNHIYGQAALPYKNISLLKIYLSERARDKLASALDFAQITTPHINKSSLPAKFQLTVNVPVQDQGVHGTCATFAASAAIDAALHLTSADNDQAGASELCALQLGAELQAERDKASLVYPSVPYENSGWVGMDGASALQRYAAFGYVPKSYQIELYNSKLLCGALSYPAHGNTPAGVTTPSAYQQFSHKSFTAGDYKPVFSAASYPFGDILTDAYLYTIKQALVDGNYVTIGFNIDDAAGENTAGAVGMFHKANDAWLVNKKIQHDMRNAPHIIDGHEILVTGYDDAAKASYIESGANATQQGLLTLRNSWGKHAGDSGDFYMSYAYFKLMAFEGNIVLTVHAKT